ncbi:Complex I assembly factor TMEM126B, mitochondrial [Microtus ochrogaster]|uniref:Complex I assembly factor TMEM126B, mitochondrial n=1 Tax=Microtus ochrogaster TaxID=79684 RepID=A0A8J6KKA3_MICOH|nr:Complex I assembly factor TMEM126B, mitochondrial [Microtus ochrogaster]
MAAPQPQAGPESRAAAAVLRGDGEAPQDIKMALYTHGRLIPSLGDAKLTRPIMGKKSDYNKQPYILGTLFFGTTSATSGVLANLIFRNSFKVRHEALKTYVSLTTLPFLSTIVTFKLFVTDALESGNISRENCVWRSMLIGVTCGVTYPTVLAFNTNGRLAVKYLLQHGSTYVGLNAAFSGLLANSLFRRILHVTQARLASGLPMALMPFMTASMTFTSFVSLPLSSGDLNCETCAMTRGALVGFGMGGVYPILFALPVNGGLAAR